MTDEEQTRSAAVPSPGLFARHTPVPGMPTRATATAGDDGSGQPPTTGGPESRFAPTDDARVDDIIAALPDPGVHLRVRDDGPEAGGAGGDRQTGRDDAIDDAGQTADPASGSALPDPGLLDAHIDEVAGVHRRLQQRLSDLSG